MRYQSASPVEGIYGYLAEYYQASIEAARHGDNGRPGLHSEVPRYVRALIERDRRKLPELQEGEDRYPTQEVKAVLVFNLDQY